MQLKYNKILKIFTLNILKYLLENILHKESDFSSIKSNKAILNYRLYEEYDILILIRDSFKLLILNVCDNIIY